MNIPALRTFLAVVETGALSRAADRLNVSQSTVTARLNTLEETLGHQLFHRRKSGAELTSAGFKFQRYAELMVQLWKQAQHETGLPAAAGAICNLGCHFDLWRGLVEQVAAGLKGGAQRIAFSVWPGEQAEIERWLGSGLIDAAFCHGRLQGDGLVQREIGAERLVLYATRPRALMRWDPAYVYVDYGEAFRRDHAAAYPDGDTPMVTFGAAAWAVDFLLAHGGSAHLPAHMAAPLVAERRLHVVPEAPVFERPVLFVTAPRAAASAPWLAEQAARCAALLAGGPA